MSKTGVNLHLLAIMSKYPSGYAGGYEYETTASTRKSVEAVVSCLLLEFFIDKARYSQPARRDLYPRFVRPFATRLVGGNKKKRAEALFLKLFALLGNSH